MSERIAAIQERHDRAHPKYVGSAQDGFQVTTTEQVIWLGIDNGQSCCEHWGYLLSEDDPQRFIGAELRNIVVTDTNRTSRVIKREWDSTSDIDSVELSGGEAMFIDLETDRGVLQFAAYNAHNGYYGHEVTVESRQLTLEQTL